MFLALSLVDKFILDYEEQRQIHQENSKKLHQIRKKQFLSNSSSQWKSIQPVSHQQINLEESYEFLLKFRNQLKTFFRQGFISQIKKRRDKLSLVYKEEKLESIQQNEKQSIKQSSLKNLQTCPFITSDFNATTVSDKFPKIDLMNLSNFASGFSPKAHNFLKTNKTAANLMKKQQSKFFPIKLNHSKSRIKVHPAKNKYQSRKKQEIRLFLQLDQKTQHLENFQSEQGKFFKFNENLKVTVRNVNMCRIVLLSKKSAIMQQFSRLGDDNYFLAINHGIAMMENEILKTEVVLLSEKQSKKQLKQNIPVNVPTPPPINIKTEGDHQRFISQLIPQPKSIPRHSRDTFQSEPQVVYKEKALRIKNYIQETTKYFAQVQAFLVRFLVNDKGYENYKKQNSLKEKISAMKTISEQEKFYREFIDKCFHISQISRLYFNALNQFAHQSINLKEIKLLNKIQLDKENKRLIELRYGLIYMQKECQNTTESTFFNQTLGEGMLGKLNRTTIMNQPSQMIEDKTMRVNVVHSSEGNLRSLLKNKQIMKTTVSSVLKQTHNIFPIPIAHTQQQSHKNNFQSQQIQQQHNRKKPLSCAQLLKASTINNVKVKDAISSNNIVLDNFDKQKIPGIKRGSKQIVRQARISTNGIKQQQQMDINMIWKTFYNKKFSSKAIRIRLY